LGAEAKSGVATAEAAAFADQAVASLRDAISAGWNWPDELTSPPAATSSQRPTESSSPWTGDAAMALLRDAVSKGHKDVAHMKTDTALDPLRQREHFQMLVAELEGNLK
jgi:hypothetical protein